MIKMILWIGRSHPYFCEERQEANPGVVRRLLSHCERERGDLEIDSDDDQEDVVAQLPADVEQGNANQTDRKQQHNETSRLIAGPTRAYSGGN